MFEQLLLRPAEAAKSLGVCRAKLYNLIQAGEIPSVRLGGSIRVPADQLRAVIAQRTLNGCREAITSEREDGADTER